MKQLIHIFLLSFSIFLMFSCSAEDLSLNNEKDSYIYSIQVTSDDKPAPNAKVIAIINETEEIIVDSDTEGRVVINSSSPVKQVCAVSLGKSGVVDVFGEDNLVVQMNNIPKEGLKKTSTATLHYYPVMWVDGEGDVKFRYLGARRWIKCQRYLPWILMSPDPNDWLGWELTDWLPTYKGYFMTVPKRYQTYHQTAYGYSIVSSLYLVALH